MVLNELISIFDKINTSKRAAQFAFSSLILLIPTSFFYAIVFDFKKNSIQPIPEGRALSIVLNEMPQGLSIVTLTLITALITSTCFLVIDFIVSLGSELKAINTKLLRLQRRKLIEETILVKRAKRIRLLLDEEIDERVGIVKMFYPDKNIIKISSDCHDNAISSLVSDKIIRVAFFSDRSGDTYICLDSRNADLIRIFLEKDLDWFIRSREEKLELIVIGNAIHTVLSTFFDFFYYLVVCLFLLSVMFSLLGVVASVLDAFSR